LATGYIDAPPPLAGASGFGRIPDDVEDTLLLFRLYRAGDIAFAGQSVKDTAGNISRRYSVRTMSDLVSPVRYSFEQTDCNEWDAFSDEMKVSPNWRAKWFQVARRFFLYGGAKEFAAEFEETDRVVDYMIALEATFVPERDFVSRRVRERGARLLGSAQVPDEETLALLRKFYGIRSTIVHGSPITSKQKNDLLSMMPSFEKVVRQLLVAAFRRLPTNDEDRCHTLRELFDVSDEDSAKAALEHIDRISDLTELNRVKKGVQDRREAQKAGFLAKAIAVSRKKLYSVIAALKS
jgi:Apea-like HEPN